VANSNYHNDCIFEEYYEKLDKNEETRKL